MKPDQLKLPTVENHSGMGDHMDEVSARRSAARVKAMADVTQSLCAHPRLRVEPGTLRTVCPDCCLSLDYAGLWALVRKESPF